MGSVMLKGELSIVQVAGKLSESITTPVVIFKRTLMVTISLLCSIPSETLKVIVSTPYQLCKELKLTCKPVMVTLISVFPLQVKINGSLSKSLI